MKKPLQSQGLIFSAKIFLVETTSENFKSRVLIISARKFWTEKNSAKNFLGAKVTENFCTRNDTPLFF